MQSLHYLDSSELNDNDNLRSLDIVNNASFRLSVWSNLEKLMRCVHENDFAALLTCSIQTSRKTHDGDKDVNEGIKNESDSDEGFKDYSQVSQSHDLLKKGHKNAEIALFVASQLGRLNIIKKLLKLGVDVSQ